MTLQELCEPLFLYMCRLNRSARKGAPLQYKQARGEIEGILADMRAKAATEPGLSSELDKVETALIFFVDSLIAESQLPFAAQWHENRLAFERNELAGDEKFFDLLDETMAEKGEAADRRLAVFFTCLGLGFTGWYGGQPEYLRSKMMEMSVRLRGRMDADDAARICPEAYENVDTRDLIQPPGARLIGIAIAVVATIILIFIVNVVIYETSTDELGKALETITAKGEETP